MDNGKVKILLVEDNKDFAKLVQVYLQRFDREKFSIEWKENYADTIAQLDASRDFDIILMDYFLPGKNGLEITRELLERKIDIPVVFLTVNKDFELAVDVMKLGVDDYLVKEEISSPVLPTTVLAVIEKHRLKQQLVELELTQQRLKAIRDTMRNVLDEFEKPLAEMKTIADQFKQTVAEERLKNYVRIIDDNVERIIGKLEKLKTLNAYKTVRYIKDIQMIDLS